MVKTFPKQDMLDMLDGDKRFKVIHDKVVDNSRWSIQSEVVFEFEDKTYRTYYSRGATEQQDEGPFEYDDEVECTEVKAVEKMVIVYEPVN